MVKSILETLEVTKMEETKILKLNQVSKIKMGQELINLAQKEVIIQLLKMKIYKKILNIQDWLKLYDQIIKLMKRIQDKSKNIIMLKYKELIKDKMSI